MRQLHHGAQWHLFEVRYLRKHERVFVIALLRRLTKAGSDPGLFHFAISTRFIDHAKRSLRGLIRVVIKQIAAMIPDVRNPFRHSQAHESALRAKKLWIAGKAG